jgi:hypothetical protein
LGLVRLDLEEHIAGREGVAYISQQLVDCNGPLYAPEGLFLCTISEPGPGPFFHPSPLGQVSGWSYLP